MVHVRNPARRRCCESSLRLGVCDVLLIHMPAAIYDGADADEGEDNNERVLDVLHLELPEDVTVAAAEKRHGTYQEFLEPLVLRTAPALQDCSLPDC